MDVYREFLQNTPVELRARDRGSTLAREDRRISKASAEPTTFGPVGRCFFSGRVRGVGACPVMMCTGVDVDKRRLLTQSRDHPTHKEHNNRGHIRSYVEEEEEGAGGYCRRRKEEAKAAV